jgi:hypothetical protein
VRRYYISPADFKASVIELSQKKGETLNLNWYQGFEDMKDLYIETEPIWLDSIYATGTSESGIEYTRPVCEIAEDESFLMALAEKVKFDPGKLKLICTSGMPPENGWPVYEIAFCYNDE